MIKMIQQALKHADFDALILTSEVARRYATGFHSTAGVCYITCKRACFMTDFRYLQAAKEKISDMEILEIKSGQNYSTQINACMRHDKIKRAALEDRTLTYAEFMQWTEQLLVESVPMGAFLDNLRLIKTPQEIQCIVRAQRIAERALTEIYNEIKPGVTEKQIAARLTYLMLVYGAENMSFDPIVVSGANSAKPHGVPTDKPIAAGDFVTMDFGCIVDGYCSDMTRTVAVQSCTEQMQQVYDIVLQAQMAGISAVHAGVSGIAVDAAARELITQAGYGENFGHGFGHGVGLNIHELPTASMRGSTALLENTVVTAEPGIYLPGKFGVRIEDMLLVTQNGARNLTQAPKELLILT